MGRQPFGLASPAAWLRDAGFEVRCLDLSRQRLTADALQEVDLVAWYLPMHTATRLALPVIDRVRQARPDVPLCAYGLYAPLNAELLRAHGVDTILGAEFEEDLVAVARDLAGSQRATGNGQCGGRTPDVGQGERTSGIGRRTSDETTIPRLSFLVPDRAGLPPLAAYASLHMPDGERRIVGYTEASRGCKHVCRHCPIVPVYNGRFRIVQPDVVLADVRAQVEAGARHITFGDPDFFNGPRHALQIVERLAREWPGLTYDATIKIEHLLRHADLLPRLAATGCLYVTSAVESVDDGVLEKLAKGHTRADFERAVGLCRAAGLAIQPTFVAFHPWLTRRGYLDLLDTIDALDLVDAVAPIQLAIRLIVPHGSRLLELPEIQRVVKPFDPGALSYPWTHEDPVVDTLQREVMALVGSSVDVARHELFEQIRTVASARTGIAPAARPRPAARARATVPFLNEPWYC